MGATLIRIILVLVLAGCAPVLAGQSALPVSGLAVVTASGARHEFSVELAVRPEDQAVGLMFRTSLDPRSGMLFDFGQPRPAAMWMKNTLIPLDMLFIDAAGQVVHIHERAVPRSLQTISSGGQPVRAVLELNGGTVARLGIRPGDRIDHPIFHRQ